MMGGFAIPLVTLFIAIHRYSIAPIPHTSNTAFGALGAPAPLFLLTSSIACPAVKVRRAMSSQVLTSTSMQ